MLCTCACCSRPWPKALRQVELGKLDLDKPVYTYIDPWNAKQGRPTLKELWNGDETINQVTGRQLLGMRGGVQDYDDRFLFNWTLYHPNNDYLPQMFIENVNKTFLFPPDQGGSYSGNGYVLMGMVLSAVTGADTWDQLDQMQAAFGGPEAPQLNHTLFMKTGACTQYPKVVHQYMYNYQPYALKGAAGSIGIATAKSATNLGSCSPGSSGYYPSTMGIGTPLKKSPADSAANCCSAAGTIPAAGTESPLYLHECTNLRHFNVAQIFCETGT